MAGAHGTNPTKSIVTALVANSLIAAMKLVAAAVTGSSAMLAEGFHSIADSGNQALLLVGLRRAKQPADSDHPFGHGKERFFWAFLVACSLFVIGAAFSTYEGVTGLLEGGHEEASLPITLGVLGAAAAFEAYAFSVAWAQFGQVRGGRSLWQAIREAKDPEIVTVLFEDTAALAGIAVASTGILLSHLTGEGAFDSVAAILIGVILTVVAFLLARESKALLLGEGASGVDDRAIRRAVEGVPGAARLVDLRTMHLSPDEILVAAEVEFEGGLETREIESAIERLEAEIQRSVPAARRIYVEPV